MTTNRAAYITAAKARPLEVKTAPLGTPAAGQVLIKNHAIAINPIDVKIQDLAIFPTSYPTILGQDVAGEVVSVGDNVTRFSPGDRVIGCTAGFATKQDTEKAFQNYVVLDSNLTSQIPSDMAFETAVVLPLAVTTAAAGLFNSNFLGLELPTEPARESSGQTVLVWGGASSVGTAAIQLAVAAGYKVITTASPKNFELVKKIGASQVFDYKSSSVVEDLVAALEGHTLAGTFDAVGGPAWLATYQIVQKSQGNKFIATAARGFPDPPEGVSINQVFSLSIKANGVGQAVWEGYLPKALSAGTLIPASEVIVAGEGLENVQTGIDVLRKGVSAQKIVVVL